MVDKHWRSRSVPIERVSQHNMVEVAASVEKGSKLPISPLKPFTNRLWLLKALGLPIQIEDEDGTKISNKCAAFILVAYLPLTMAVSAQMFLALTYGTNITYENLQKYWRAEGFKKWDLYSIQLNIMVPAIFPLFYLCSYKRVGVKFNQFIQLYQRTFHNLDTGKFTMCKFIAFLQVYQNQTLT